MPSPVIPTASFLPLPPLDPIPAEYPSPWKSSRVEALGGGDESDPAEMDPEWMAEPPVQFLPDGRPLMLTVHRKVMFLANFPEVGSLPATHQQGMVLLFLAANPRTVWNAPVPDAGGLLAPLWERKDAFKDFIDGWADRSLRGLSPDQILILAQRLWVGEHSNQVVPIEEPGQDYGAKKKPASQQGISLESIRSFASVSTSAQEIPGSTGNCSTTPPCGPSISTSPDTFNVED